MNRLADKIAIVTGGGSGIGAAICTRMSEEGSSLVIVDRDGYAAKRVVRSIVKYGFNAEAATCDIVDETAVADMVARVEDRYGQIDILVNCAAVFVMRSISDATRDDWRASLDVNVLGTATMMKHVLGPMRTRRGGAIVNIGSISSFLAQKDIATYSATKAAIASITKCAALDCADHNIRVNAVCPGIIWTPFVESLSRKMGLSKAEAAVHPSFGGGHMLKRFGTPEEVAHAVVFLASDEASFITGSCLMVDGGYSSQ